MSDATGRLKAALSGRYAIDRELGGSTIPSTTPAGRMSDPHTGRLP